MWIIIIILVLSLITILLHLEITGQLNCEKVIYYEGKKCYEVSRTIFEPIKLKCGNEVIISHSKIAILLYY